jgi:hypothetical protein
MDSTKQESLEAAAKRNRDMLKDSRLFLCLFTENYETDPICALQLGIAVLLDKPICLLVPRGTSIPKHVERLAEGIEYYEGGNIDDVKAATSRLVKSFMGES